MRSARPALPSSMFLAAALVTFLTTSCASVPAAEVRIVRGADSTQVGPLQSCGYVGKIETAGTSDVEKNIQRLREIAGRKGANTLVLYSEPEALHGTAFLCPGPRLASAPDIGTYGPDVPAVQRYPAGATDVPADPRH